VLSVRSCCLIWPQPSVEHKVLLPGVTTLGRLIAQSRDRTVSHLWCTLAHLPNIEQRESLLSLLVVLVCSRQSLVDRLRTVPTQPTATGLVDALRRVKQVRDIGIGGLGGLSELRLVGLPLARLKALARYAFISRAGALDDLSQDRKLATLLAFVHTLAGTA
jgi:hypothetical protein